MSRLPHPQGVTAVIDLLSEVDALEAEAEKLRPMAKRLGEVEQRTGELRRRLPELLRSMDMEAPGNFGWEKRMGWFLAEMRRQVVRGDIGGEPCAGCAKVARHPGEGYACILHPPAPKVNE